MDDFKKANIELHTSLDHKVNVVCKSSKENKKENKLLNKLARTKLKRQLKEEQND